MTQERWMERTWWRFFPFGLVLLGLLSLVAGLVTAQSGRTILQIALVLVVLSWLGIWMWSRVKDGETIK